MKEGEQMQVVINLFWLLLAVILVSIIAIFIIFAVVIIKVITQGTEPFKKKGTEDK